MGETQKTEIVAEMENTEVTAFGKKDLRTFNTLKSNIEKGFSRASDAYITIAVPVQDHTANITALTITRILQNLPWMAYELKKATTHNYIKVIEKFG